MLPLAAIEQHGPHLPVSTDTTIMQGMLGEVIAMLPDDLDIRILPIQAIGKSNEHLHAPGTLTLPAATLVEAWSELGASVARAGIRKLVIVNSHGGNEEIMGIVSRELRVRHRMLAVKTSWQRFGRPPGMYTELEDRHGIHGGDVETSLMLHFRPDLVDMAKARELRLQRRAGREANSGCCATPARMPLPGSPRDLNPHGVVGDASIATAEKGSATARFQADGFIGLLRDVKKARLADWLS